jgi:hypothetical protein
MLVAPFPIVTLAMPAAAALAPRVTALAPVSRGQNIDRDRRQRRGRAYAIVGATVAEERCRRNERRL